MQMEQNLSMPADIAAKIAKAEEILGYEFRDKELLRTALTHPSALEEHDGVEKCYERLEFLGDSIVGAIVADAAYRKFPHMDEGGLTRVKVTLVSGSHLSDKASSLGLADCMVFGNSEQGTGGRGLHSALENAFESVSAAIYLDGGIESASDFVMRQLEPDLCDELAYAPENPKSTLQEILQEQCITPTYETISQEGPPHNRTFTVLALSDGKPIGKGVGRSKKGAEVSAALDALRHIGGSS